MARNRVKLLTWVVGAALLVPASLRFAKPDYSIALHEWLARHHAPERLIWPSFLGAPLIGVALLLAPVAALVRNAFVGFVLVALYFGLCCEWWNLLDPLGGSGIGGWERYWPPLVGYFSGALLGGFIVLFSFPKVPEVHDA